MRLPIDFDSVAPTGSLVRNLLNTVGGNSSTITFTTESSSKLFTIETSTPINQILSVPSFQTMRLPINFDIVAHTGSLVRNLLITVGSSMA
ncbi:unnamed protein product [Rotaria sp. Silwood1]|nr:unnamed protein product [Rotaria sp. Silwood1]